MSRWLSGLNQVSNLLEKLDDRVENAVEERIIDLDDEVDDGESNGALINDILTKRGLGPESNIEKHNGKCEDLGNTGGAGSEQSAAMESKAGQDEMHFAPSSNNANSIEEEGPAEAPKVEDKIPETVDPRETNLNKEECLSTSTNEHLNDASKSAEPTESLSNESTLLPLHQLCEKPKTGLDVLAASKEAQKEVRVLRRHVLKLNGTLEQAENEIAALRSELTRAAGRIEKDRLRAKEEKDAALKRFAEDMSVQRSQHDQAIKEQKQRFEEQISKYKRQLSDIENRRKQEGGDWTKEITQAFEREQEMSTKMTLLEDEKVTLLNQITTLQSQQLALGSRIESLSQASENAMAREREAEDRLDATLSQHAKQISLRQAREAELERVIQQLNAALVSKSNSRNPNFLPRENESSLEASLRNRIEVLEGDLSTAYSQLKIEKEKSEFLCHQLKEMSKESSEEASLLQTERLHYQRRVAEMALTISKLESRLRDAKRDSVHKIDPASEKSSDQDMSGQVKLLSEEVLRLRDKLGDTSGELQASKNRLREALGRAAKAEDCLAKASFPTNDKIDTTEWAGNAALSGTMKREKHSRYQSTTMRSAMRLDPGQGDRSEQLGKVVDVVDGFAVSTAKYLRRKPLARAGFIMYLLVVHLWSFVLLFFHAHNFDERRVDVGSTGFGISVGPHALVEQQKDVVSKTRQTLE